MTKQEIHEILLEIAQNIDKATPGSDNWRNLYKQLRNKMAEYNWPTNEPIVAIFDSWGD